MKFENLAKLIFHQMKPKLENNRGLSVFAKERAKFEGWLKVELCDSLSSTFNDVIPENNRVDITFEDWALELKTVNTNILYENVKKKKKTITKNTQGILQDINKLKNKGYSNRAVFFVVFPINHKNKNWQEQLGKISPFLSKIKYSNFNFNCKIPGVIYFGLIKKHTPKTAK